MARNRNNKPKQEGKPKPNPRDNRKPEDDRSTGTSNENSVSQEKEVPPKDDGKSADQRGKKNDPAWYAAFPELLFAAGNFPFSYPFGSSIALSKHLGSVVYENGNTYTWSQTDNGPGVPGILTITVKNTVPGKGKQNDPINVAANAFYTHLRVVNAGRKNYDPVDAMFYNLSIAEIYSFIYFCQKLYGLAMQYSRQNFYIGEQLALDLGVNWSNLLRNLANFRYWLNAFTKKMQAYAVPNSIPYYLRKTFMYAGVYLENEDGNIKDQLYQFKPAGFYKFELDTRSRGSLKFTPWTYNRTTLANVSDIIAYGEGLISNIWGDEDFGLISGDIIKAYGSNLITVSEIPAEFTIYPVHDPYILNQFRNARLYNLDTVTKYDYSTTETGCTLGDVYQDSNGLIFCTESSILPNTAWDTIQQYVIKHDACEFFVSSKSNPEPSEVVEGTRLSVLSEGTFKDANNYVRRMLRPCCEIATEVHFTRMTSAGGVQVGSLQSNFWHDTITMGSNNFNMVFSFKYAPIMFVYKSNSTTHEVSDISVVTNVDNYTIIENSQLDKLHEVCALSLFYVPGVAQFIASKSNS